MSTENRRVAAYLPKIIDDRLEAFKADRGLRGDSPALIAILEEYFGVSQEVAHSSKFELEVLLKQVESLATKVAHLESELLGELKSSPIGDLKSELLSGLQGELFDRLKPDLKSELLSELKSELLKLDSPTADHLAEQLSIPSTQETDQLQEEASELSSESEGELLIDSDGKPLDGSVPWSGVELSKRLKRGAPQISALKDAEKLAEWSRKKDPDGLAWMRVGKGKYLPITDDHQEF
jgi:hypothetical protein